MIKKVILLLIAMNILVACTQPQLNRKEWIDLTSRSFDNISSDQILLASEKLFRLAYGDNVKITHSLDYLTARYGWSTSDWLGTTSNHTYFWQVKIFPNQNTNKVRIQIDSDRFKSSPAIYDLFWARIDYLLGNRQDWMTCETSNNRIKEKIVWGSNDPLCNIQL